VGTRADSAHEFLGGAERQLARPKGRDRLTPAAAALTVGAAAGWSWPGVPAWALLAAAAACALALIALRARLTRRGSAALLVAGAALFGTAWPIARHYAVALDDLSRYVETEPVIARLRGVVTSAPQLRQPAGGSMRQFNEQPPWLVFQLDAKALVDRHGNAHSVSSNVWVSVPSTIPHLRAGDVIEIAGLLRAPPRPRNPGQFDFWRFARAHNQSAVMSVDNPALVRVMMTNPSTTLWITRWRDALRARASAWLHADMPEAFRDGATQHRAVLQAILIGERAPELHEVGAAMQRTGLAHLMAISGLHLGILVALVLILLGVAREPKRWHGVAAIVLIAVYLMLVEVRVPVLRAGVMLGFASLGLVLGRRMAVGGLIGFSMIVMVLWAPSEVTSPGFQLSFGVVYAIIYLAPVLRERWFGRPNMLAGPTRSMVAESFKTSLCVAVVAWLVATPIVLFHFGILSPLGWVLSVVGVPAAGVVLALGYLKMGLSAILPSAGLLVGAALAWLTDTLIAAVLWIDEIPGASVALPMPGVLWTLAAVMWVVAVIHARERRTVRSVWALGVMLALWLCWPMLPDGRGEAALRIDMLAVGDGSCYVIRSGGETIVFDAGTMGDPGSGARIIVPGMRALGVRSVDTLIVSHANLDHFSAMIEVVDAFGADELLVTPQFRDEAANDPAGPAQALFEAIDEKSVPIVTVSAGARREVGEATFEWLHPSPQALYGRVNDTAMVIRISAAGRRVLLCGDIQHEAMTDIMHAFDPAALDADVMELPHHGGFSDEAVTLVNIVSPQVVLQSTGYGRLRRDRWKDALGGFERFITARDGACWVTIEQDGSINAGRFLDSAPHDVSTISAPP
jgi:competence protein ComEC